MTKTEIVNVVVTASMDQPMDFSKLKEFPEIAHSPNVYRGKVAYFKTAGMQGKVSIFQSGKMISAGTKSEAQALEELQSAMNFIVKRNLAENVELKPKIQNLVVLADLETSLDLETISKNLKAVYEPEQFPGAILRLEVPFKTSILIFASGKTVITGLKTSTQIEPTIKELTHLIESNQ